LAVQLFSCRHRSCKVIFFTFTERGNTPAGALIVWIAPCLTTLGLCMLLLSSLWMSWLHLRQSACG